MKKVFLLLSFITIAAISNAQVAIQLDEVTLKAIDNAVTVADAKFSLLDEEKAMFAKVLKQSEVKEKLALENNPNMTQEQKIKMQQKLAEFKKANIIEIIGKQKFDSFTKQELEVILYQ
jgi:E3 ubiquitin-protein ligase DOA10